MIILLKLYGSQLDYLTEVNAQDPPLNVVNKLVENFGVKLD